MLGALLSAALFASVIFLRLSSNQNATLDVEMTLGISQPSIGQVFWTGEGEGFSHERCITFDVRPGHGLYHAAVPARLGTIRIDPMSDVGTVEVHSIRLKKWGVPLRAWGGGRGFQGWYSWRDLTDLETRSGTLRGQATGTDPVIAFALPLDLRRTARAIDLLLSVVVGLALGIVHTVLVLRTVRRGTVSPETVEPTTRAPALGSQLGTALLLLISISLSGATAYWIYTRFIAGTGTHPTPDSFYRYRSYIVDRLGRRLSDKPGDLKIVLNPFTLYRNYPDQKTGQFTIDGSGYRVSVPSGGDKPLVVVLGGSAAFGLLLDADSETFTSQLNLLNTRYRFVNAGTLGFVSGQELAEMVHHADRLRPSLYITFDGWNELFMQLFPNPNGPEFGFNWSVVKEIEGRLYRLATLEGVAGKASRAPADLPTAEKEERIFKDYSENLTRMRDFAQSRGAKFLVAFQPHLGSKRNHASGEAKAWNAWGQGFYPVPQAQFIEQYRRLLERTQAICDTRGIAWVNLDASPRFRDDPGELFVDGVHPNARGHRIIAELLQERLNSVPNGH